MRSMFLLNGIHNPRVTSWMGAGYQTYTQEQIAEENRKAEEQRRLTAEANARAAQIQQNTAQINANAMSDKDKIMGLDKPVFFLGATLLVAAVVGGGFMMMKGK